MGYLQWCIQKQWEQNLSITLVWIQKSITTIKHVEVFIVIVHKKLSIAVVYTKVKWNIASNVVYFKSATKKFQFQVFIKTLSHEKDKYKNCQM